MILIKKINEVFVRIIADDGTLMGITEKFTFKAPNYRFHPRYKAKVWNGDISLFKRGHSLFYIGLLPDLVKYLNDNKLEFKIQGPFASQEFSEKEALDFIKTLNLPPEFIVRDYQLKYFIKCVRNSRAVCLSPTNSGKSLIIYLIYRYFNEKTLLIVPTVALVTQMYKDFISYGYDAEENTTLIMEGNEKTNDTQLVISTWQSLMNLESNWFDDFRVVFGDEVHHFQAKSIKILMENIQHAPSRFGFTGTLTKEDLNNMTIQGLFGPICKYISQKQLIDRKFSSDILIKTIILDHIHSPYYENDFKIEYQEEINYILNSPERNRFTRNLALSLKGNTFIMFRIIDHGKPLYDDILKNSKVPVFYVDGSTSAEEREKIRNEIDKLKDSITVCSSVFSTGINIKSVNNIIFSHPSKSRIKVLQSIGRGLRKVEGKNLLIFDIADRLIYEVDNTTISHLNERKEMYQSEQFPFKEYNVSLKRNS